MRVITPDVGGGFGTKLFPYREYALAAVAARKLGKPVKWIADRTEHFLGDSQGRDNITTAKLALDDEGQVSSRSTSILVADMGAYLSCLRAVTFPWLGAGMSPGVYDIPACHRARARRLHQHRAGRCLSRRRPAGSGLRDRAAGRCRRARARHRARRAAAANFIKPKRDALHDRDRQDLRLRRLRRRTWRARRKLADWDGFKQARGGFAQARQAARHRHCDLYRGLRQHGPGHRDAVSSTKDGSVTVLIGSQSTGQGHAHRLCADRRRASRPAAGAGARACRATPTRSRPAAAPAARARSRAAARRSTSAAKKLADNLKKLAADALEAAAGDLEIRRRPRARRRHRPRRSRSPISPRSRRAAPICSRPTTPSTPEQPTYPNGTHIAEVEIDRGDRRSRRSSTMSWSTISA